MCQGAPTHSTYTHSERGIDAPPRIRGRTDITPSASEAHEATHSRYASAKAEFSLFDLSLFDFIKMYSMFFGVLKLFETPKDLLS